MNEVIRIADRWHTVATVGYTAPVCVREQNPAAWGAVCHLQIRRDRRNGRTLARRVNTNGRHEERSVAFYIDAETLAQWQRIGRDQRR